MLFFILCACVCMGIYAVVWVIGLGYLALSTELITLEF